MGADFGVGAFGTFREHARRIGNDCHGDHHCSRDRVADLSGSTIAHPGVHCGDDAESCLAACAGVWLHGRAAELAGPALIADDLGLAASGDQDFEYYAESYDFWDDDGDPGAPVFHFDLAARPPLETILPRPIMLPPVSDGSLALLPLRAGALLILAGALGNLYDRVSLGYVVDFISLHYGGWYFPAFNLADSCISVGAALLLLEWVIEPRSVSDD